ncbi:MAG: caspase family protein, partial [Bacteroidales bacterium]|nr:caspase family protein [Bacteroidales bacterium]
KKMKKAGQYAMKTFDVSLIPGENVITVSAFNNGMIESAQQNIKLYHKGTPKLSNCYVVSVGINKYENPSLNLNYAKPDAQAISSLIDKKGNQLFKEVKTFEFYDTKATKENIFNALDDISNEMQPEDVFIFYYAGHGSMINNYFYFITTESTGLYQEDKLQSAIHVTELQNRLKKLPALKQVVIMDACHSGTSVDLLAMRGASEEKALAQLSRSSGIHVLASTGKQQQAAETGVLGHGIFTFVLLEALMGKADGAPKDSKVTVYELKSYLDDQVPEVSYRLLGHKQYPNTFSIGHDFPLIFEIE